MTNTIGYDPPEDEDGITLLSIAPAGSPMDRTLKASLRKIAADNPDSPIAARVEDVLKGRLSVGELTRSAELAPMMAKVSEGLRGDLAKLSDDEKDALRRGELPDSQL